MKGIMKGHDRLPPIMNSGVRSLKELWEGNGSSHSHSSDTVMGTRRNQESSYEKKFASVSRQFFFENC